MLSSRIDPDDADSEEDASAMPGNHQPRPRAASRVAPRTRVSPRRPSMSPTSRPPRAINSAAQPKPWPPFMPNTSPVRSRRRRRRAITPEIVVERRHHHHHHRSSGRDRIITIPLDNRPTLGLRGPPKRVLELERVRCRRHRRHRPSCYEIQYDIPPPVPIQIQPNVMYADPLSNPYLLPAQPPLIVPTNNSATWLTTFSNLTPQMVENLPKQTVHLPSIYLPGSQADANTELETVLFPAEIVNPIDGTLSIIQSNSTVNSRENAVARPASIFPTQPQFISAPITAQPPLGMLSMASGPFMQQVQDLFQRINLSQSSPYNQTTTTQPFIPLMSQYNPAMNSFYNPQTAAPINTTNSGPYRPANIQPVVVPNSGPYNTTTFTPVRPTNTTMYPPANITPYHPVTSTPYPSVNNRTYQPTNTAPYSPASIPVYTPLSTAPYRPTNMTPYQPITSNYALSNPTNARSSRDIGATPSNSSDIGPYRPANITPYSAGSNRPSDSSTRQPPIPSGSLASSTSFSSFSSALNNRPLQAPQTPYHSSTPMPKSILRNSAFNRPLNTTYTRSNPLNVFSSNGIVRELATAV